MSCPKCGGQLVDERESFRAPAHFRCLQCGLYREHEARVVMPQFPPPDYPFGKPGRVAKPRTVAEKLEHNLRGHGAGVPKKRRMRVLS